MATQIAERTDAQKKAVALSHKRDTVLVKVTTMNYIPGIRVVERNEKAVQERHKEIGAEIGISDLHNARQNAIDTGKLVVQGVGRLSKSFFGELRGLGLKPTDVHCHKKHGRDGCVWVTTISFTSEGEEVKVPDQVMEVLARKGKFSVWANLVPEAEGFKRVDTVNLRDMHSDKPDGSVVSVSGRTYKVV